MKLSNERPNCFGDLNRVFPLCDDGLRVTPAECLQCSLKTQCLRSAMRGKQGLTVRQEMLERAYRGGMMGFFQRWSQKKALHRRSCQLSRTPKRPES